MKRVNLAALVLVALPALAGCGGAPPAEAPPTGCAAMRDLCRRDQQACVEDASGTPGCVACAVGQYAALSGKCEVVGATPTVHDFAMFTVNPGEEVLGLCQSWSLNNPTELWVNAVELVQDEASHHSNWTYVPNTKFDGPDGIWKCQSRNYSQLEAALAGGLLYAQSTQASHEVQRFPNGAAVRIPPWSRIIGDVHLLNASIADTVTGHAQLRIYTLAPAEVKIKLTPWHLTYDALAIPPHAYSRFTGTCLAGEDFYNARNTDWDLQIYYLLPHTHAQGRREFVQVVGGKLDGQTIFDVPGVNGEARGRAFDPPLDLRGANGVRFACEYDNPGDDTLTWGFGPLEMCDVLGFASTAMAFESTVGKNHADGMEGSTDLFSGPCNTVLFNWDFNKPGGMPH